MKKFSAMLSLAGAGGARLDTSSPAAYRASITRMADAAGRGNYGKTRAALLAALHELQSRFVNEYLADKQRSWGRQVEAQARFDALMQGKTSQEILALSRNGSTLH